MAFYWARKLFKMFVLQEGNIEVLIEYSLQTLRLDSYHPENSYDLVMRVMRRIYTSLYVPKRTNNQAKNNEIMQRIVVFAEEFMVANHLNHKFEMDS